MNNRAAVFMNNGHLLKGAVFEKYHFTRPYMCICVYVFVCICVRVCARACVCVQCQILSFCQGQV